ncbi:alkaline phosphatase family protein [Acinetobacter haemolyticus ATCC 19194]|uniref:Alkaline phosphatase family protein n=1 Tax=Acinetobacter haemolyticus ATCC 19194 TaxID=707232 RepID=D4XQQ7_ACIHA|nr:alkaline phosphatase [Acinetobacter haemolyticus]EFF82468.1 alkaline phosphatase family protein [Acinetobacter haemolyticus ATCC 19194]
MKLKPLLLPILITPLLLTACGGDDNNYSSSNQSLEKPKPPVTTPQFDGELLEVGANGNVSEFGGATRLKKERTQAMRESLSDKTVKHAILFIGDGTSDSEITAARNYAEGAAGYFKGLDVIPFTGSYTTYSLNKDGEVDYVTDSAASATAWASGIKTYNNALGLDIRGNHHATLLELAKKAGFATGNVTTTELQDATPAALVSHISARKCYGPNETTKRCPESALENGGLGSITEQLLTTRADVTLGGGKKTFYEVAKAGPFKDKTLLERAKLENYRIVEDLNSLKAVDSANQNQPLLGLFADGNLPVIWSGPVTQLNGHKKGAESCRDNSAFSIQTPRLAQMTEKAIELLSNNEKGFFLQVESGSIDKRNHAADPCGQIGETVQLDEAIQVALKFAKEHGETLIVVTGDHAHTSQIIPINGDSPGQTAALKTKDGVAMAINYGTAPEGSSQHHTGAQVRIAAYGPRAANVSGLLDQTDLFFIIRDALGIQQNASR